MTAISIIGLFGCLNHELNNLFLDGVPFPLIYIVIIGIIMETIGLLAGIMPFNEMVHETNSKSLKPVFTYMFGSIAICVYLFFFIIAYLNFMAQPPGDSNNSEWGPIIFMSYIGIIIQIYLMYKILKQEKMG